VEAPEVLELPEVVLELPEVVLELPEVELELLELLELSLEGLDVAGVADVPVELVVPPVELVVPLECVDPGSAKATAPAIATLATPAPVVATRTLARPRFLAANASLILSLSMFQASALGFQNP